MTDEYWQRYLSAVDEIGWNKSSLITQWLASFCSVNRAYLQKCAELDAQARGFDSAKGDYFSLCRNWEELPAYTDARPIFDPSPLAAIAKVETSSQTRRSFNAFRASGINSAFFHLLCEIEQDNAPKTISRIAVWHIDKYWDKSYRWQLEADTQLSFRPEF